MSVQDDPVSMTHLDHEGRARMVDVGGKEPTERVARASSRIAMRVETLAAILADRVEKGAVLATARIAGIMAAKRCSELIPLCHQIALTAVTVEFAALGADRLEIRAEARTRDRTGVEMEALTACSVAALTVYDMCKAIDRGMEIRSTALDYKAGGKSGVWERRRE